MGSWLLGEGESVLKEVVFSRATTFQWLASHP